MFILERHTERHMILPRFFPVLAIAMLVSSAGSITAQRGVTAVLPNGREIRPAGNWIPMAPYPFVLAVRPDGAQIAAPSIGFPFAINVIDSPLDEHPSVRRMPAGSENVPEIEVHAGLVYSLSGESLYVATGDSGKIRAYKTADWTVAGEVALDGQTGGKEFSGSFAATLALSPDGRHLYALDQGNWRIVILNANTLERIASVPTGAYPFGLAGSPDGKRLYVTNSGLFEYSMIPGGDAKDPLKAGLRFPPFGYPSKEAREGTVAEGRQIPGLGDENSDRGSSLWTYDISDPSHPAVTARLRLGAPIGDETVGGAAPNGVAADSEGVFVSLAPKEAVVEISDDGKQVLAQTELSPLSGPRFADSAGRPLRGVMPSGIAVRAGRMYVAESGINA